MSDAPVIISSKKLLKPRLELRYRHAVPADGFDAMFRTACDYNLVLPLDKYDIRREDRNTGTRIRTELTVKINTSATDAELGSNGWTSGPYRDRAHAQWDSKKMGGLPIYVVCRENAVRLKVQL